MKRTIVATMLFLLCFLRAQAFTNHLDGQSSPYLKQHLHNPVDWYPWGEEAFKKAKKEHKPIFLSIGYSTCHWCHVMAKESFENPEIAALINRWFVAVKVDREERPDLDRHFQRIYSLLHRRSGGWPLSVFLTEDGEPFFVTTYIPPEDSYGVKGMKTLIPYFGRLYRDAPQKLRRRAEAIDKLLHKASKKNFFVIRKDLSLVDEAVKKMQKYYDETYKGFWDSPKFPESARIRLLLEIWKVIRNETAKKMALETLDAMQASGLYDQAEGAFFRYCVDRAWLIPHFEKMLYTSAELIPLYVQAYQMTGNERFATVVGETIDETNRRFRTPEGLYFSASNADSDGEEGGYYLYRYDEVLKRLKEAGFSEKEAKELMDFFDIQEEGNFDTERAHLHRKGKKEPKGYKKAKAVLKEIRRQRTYPFIDRKIITAWNGMMIKALFVASRIKAENLSLAEESYRTLKKTMSQKGGALFHQTLYSRSPTQPGMLEDYAFMIDAALQGYETTLKEGYLKDAQRWCDLAIEKFYAGDGKWLLNRGKIETEADISDNYYTSPLSKMLVNLGKLALLESEPKYLDIEQKTLARHGEALQNRPDAYPEALRAWMQMKKGWIGLKSNRKNLIVYRHRIEAIDYPYILMKAQKSDIFVACDMRTCFAFGKDFDSVAKAIESRETDSIPGQ